MCLLLDLGGNRFVVYLLVEVLRGGKDDGGVPYGHGVLDMLRSIARTEDVPGEIGRVLGLIPRNETAKLALISDEVALVIGETSVVVEDRGAGPTATFCGSRGGGGVHGVSDACVRK